MKLDESQKKHINGNTQIHSTLQQVIRVDSSILFSLFLQFTDTLQQLNYAKPKMIMKLIKDSRFWSNLPDNQLEIWQKNYLSTFEFDRKGEKGQIGST